MSLLLLSALLLALPCPALTPPDGCPQVYRVFPETVVEEPPLKILFLGDGFLDEDLNTYRCAVESLASKVLHSSMISDYACAIGIYRMDFVDPPGGAAILTTSPVACEGDSDVPEQLPEGGGRIPVDASCSDCVCQGHDVTAQYASTCDTGVALRPDAAPCGQIPEDRRFRTALCRRGLCRLVWPELQGEVAAMRYSACVPDGGADLVIIISNTGAIGGGGRMVGDVPLATLTLSDIDYPASWQRLAHELGHALFGLLDEYENPYNHWSYRPGLNVVSTWELQRGIIPWEEECTDETCDIRCAAEALNTPSDTVAVVEGSFYHACGFYRSMAQCRMRHDHNDYCDACKLAARGVMNEQYQLGLCADPDE